MTKLGEPLGALDFAPRLREPALVGRRPMALRLSSKRLTPRAALLSLASLLAFALAPSVAHAAEPDAAPPASVADPAAPPAAGAANPAAPAPVPAEPQGYRMDNYRSPVPLTLQGARVLTADEAADIWNKGGAVFIDVYPQAPKPANLPPGTFWRDPVHRSIEGAQWLPNVGYGGLSAASEAYFRSGLGRLSKGKRDTPLIFFCLKDCWMSWNAAKRAVEAGYSNVMWFRDGTDGWEELGYPLEKVDKLP
jgi:PQQ-dependent catabolism-associated CXXCW motif protein